MAAAHDSEGWPWPAPDDDGAAAHLTAGLPLPDLELPTTGGRRLSLATVDGLLLLFVHPWVGRPGVPNPPHWDDIAGAHGSTAELQAVATLFDAYRRLGATVIAVSGQTPDEQREIVARLRLPFELASDHDGRLRDRLRLPAFETGGVRYLRRLSLIADRGRIARVFYPVHPPHTHPREVLVVTAAEVPSGRPGAG